MAQTIDRNRVEELVRSALAGLPSSSAGAGVPPLLDGGGAVLMPPEGDRSGQAYDAENQKALIASTPARVAVGRAGTRYRTATLLRFRADHAAAKDAVMSEVDKGLIARLGFVELASQATSKRHFLERPDAGRALSPESRELLTTRCAPSPQVQLCYGDGLSAAAINAHLETFHGALVAAAQKRGMRLGTPVFVRYSRVKVMDEIARLLSSETCVFACGERPGLGFADSLSAYYIYRPGEGATDANREVTSNINPRGLTPVQAADVVAGALERILSQRRSGVVMG